MPTRFVSASVNEVYHTLIEAGILVLIVILVFLQDIRATLVPATDRAGDGSSALRGNGRAGLHREPVHPVRHRAGDSASSWMTPIVVVEGTAHYIEKGFSGHDATVEAMRDLFGRYRHHAGPDVRVPSRRVSCRPDRTACTPSSRWSSPRPP